MSAQKHTDPGNISKVQDNRKNLPTADTLFRGILTGEKSALARAITLVESKRNNDWAIANDILEQCLHKQTQSVRIGITGVPGVGKSTFIETFGKHLTAQGKKVAVLAIDPSSGQTKGSILGDKTRMPELSKDPNAFIRPSPSGETLGGVARKTRESIILCEAAGYDVVLVETVGVGQSEVAVHSMVDFFLLLKLAGAGDELQGIKRGIIEMADAIVINKSDGDNLKKAQLAEVEFKRALQLYPPKDNGWIPTVSSCSSVENTGIVELWSLIQQYYESAKESGYLISKRKSQNKHWLFQTIEDRILLDFYENKKVGARLDELSKQVVENVITPFRAAELLLQLQKKELK